MDNKELKVAIIGGVVASVIVIIFIQPILSFVWNVATGIGGAIGQGYVDRIYREAALTDRNLIGHMAFIILFFFLLPLMALSYRSYTGRAALDPQPVALSLSFRVAMLVVWLVIASMFMVSYSISTGTMEISASFTQRLTVLAPAISDGEYKTLKARWASMRGEADYEALVDEMNRRATELGITLPPVRKP